MGGEGNSERARGAGRRVTYCLVPRELAEKLHELLRQHFAADPAVEVIVERRGRERRAGADRRQGTDERPAGEERRQVRSTTGRRIGERRAALSPVEAPELPRRARRYAERLSFVERREPSTERAEDEDTARLVARYQAGEDAALATLYTRYFSRVYGYVRLVLDDRHEAEDVTQQVFLQLMEALPTYERRRQPFRAWLFVAVRNAAISHLRKQGRIVLDDPATVARHAERAALEDEDEDGLEPFALHWVTDGDLLVLLERLPLPQRQVLTLRYMLDMPTSRIAAILDRTPADVRKLQHRAQAFLRERLTALGRAPDKGSGSASWQRRLTQVKVLRDRRFALK